MIDRIADGRTDLVFEYLSAGHSVSAVGPNGTRIIEWCAYFDEVSAIKFLLANGESLHKISASMPRPFTAIGDCAST